MAYLMAKLLKREKPRFNYKHRDRQIKLLQQPLTCKTSHQGFSLRDQAPC